MESALFLKYTGDSAEKLEDGAVKQTAKNEDNTQTHTRNVCVMRVAFLMFLLFMGLFLMILCCLIVMIIAVSL